MTTLRLITDPGEAFAIYATAYRQLRETVVVSERLGTAINHAIAAIAAKKPLAHYFDGLGFGRNSGEGRDVGGSGATCNKALLAFFKKLKVRMRAEGVSTVHPLCAVNLLYNADEYFPVNFETGLMGMLYDREDPWVSYRTGEMVELPTNCIIASQAKFSAQIGAVIWLRVGSRDYLDWDLSTPEPTSGPAKWLAEWQANDAVEPELFVEAKHVEELRRLTRFRDA